LETTTKSTGAIGKRRIVQAMVALLITMVCWSLSNPPGSTPDEWFQLGSIWCANGIDDKHCLELYPGGEKSPYATGLADIDSQSCLVDTRSAIQRCSEVQFGIHLRAESGYPVWYYRFMNLFVPIGNSLSVLTMRMMNSLIAVGFLFLQLQLCDRRKKISILTAFTFTLFPMAIFLLSSIHPSGWALTGVANGWLFLLTAISKPKLRPLHIRLAWIGWIVCGLMTMASRYEAFLYFAASNLIAIAATYPPTRWLRWKIILPTTATLVLGGIAILRLNEIASWALKFPFQPQPGQNKNAEWISHWVLQLIAVPVESLGTGLIGQRPLIIPHVVWIVGIALLGGVLLFSFIKTSVSQLVAFCGSLIMLAFIVLSFSGRLERDFFNLSGRYIIPLVPFIVGLCIYLSKSPVQLMEIRRLRILAIVLLSVTHAIALHSVVETYVDGQSFAFLPISVGESGWWWIGLPFGPNFIVLVGTLSFAKFLTLIWSTISTVQISVAPSVDR
jgi:hypothetical protein